MTDKERIYSVPFSEFDKGGIRAQRHGQDHSSTKIDFVSIAQKWADSKMDTRRSSKPKELKSALPNLTKTKSIPSANTT